MASKTIQKYVPDEVSDILMHHKENEGLTEEVVLPITRYDNVLCRPRLVTSVGDLANGAPFNLFSVATEVISDAELEALYNSVR